MGNLIPEEAYSFIGKETGPGKPKKIEAGALRKFARAIGHTFLVYGQQDESGSNSLQMPMPPAFLLTNLESGIERDFQIPLRANRRVRGGTNLKSWPAFTTVMSLGPIHELSIWWKRKEVPDLWSL
jgi:hypothetical protein